MSCPGQPRFKKILVVDDDKIDVYISVKILKEANFSADIVFRHSIKEALDYLQDTYINAGKLPDLVFLYWDMPGECSIDFLKQFRALC